MQYHNVTGRLTEWLYQYRAVDVSSCWHELKIIRSQRWFIATMHGAAWYLVTVAERCQWQPDSRPGNVVSRSWQQPTVVTWYLTFMIVSHSVDITKQSSNEKNAQRRRKHRALAVVRWSQKFCLAANPLPGGAGRPKFIQLDMVTTFTYKPSLMRIDAHNFKLSW